MKQLILILIAALFAACSAATEDGEYGSDQEALDGRCSINGFVVPTGYGSQLTGQECQGSLTGTCVVPPHKGTLIVDTSHMFPSGSGCVGSFWTTDAQNATTGLNANMQSHNASFSLSPGAGPSVDVKIQCIATAPVALATTTLTPQGCLTETSNQLPRQLCHPASNATITLAGNAIVAYCKAHAPTSCDQIIRNLVKRELGHIIGLGTVSQAGPLMSVVNPISSVELFPTLTEYSRMQNYIACFPDVP